MGKGSGVRQCFMLRMQFSVYSSSFRYQVLNSTLAAYNRVLSRDVDGNRPMYRPKEWNREERLKLKKGKKVNWYKQGGFESVIFVPATPRSALQKSYQEVVRDSGIKIRVVERAGRTVKTFLQRSNPFRTQFCDKEDCFVCISGGKGDCRASGVTYEISCVQCKTIDQPVRYKYIGETARNAYSRGKEHLAGLRNKSKTSCLWEHCRDIHCGEVVNFQMSVLKRYKNDCMLRQIMESVIIENSENNTLLNTKSEFNYVTFSLIAMFRNGQLVWGYYQILDRCLPHYGISDSKLHKQWSG